jgi:PilZ domain
VAAFTVGSCQRLMRHNAEPQMLLWKKPEERRQAQRFPLERLAKIQVGVDMPPRICLVVDISGGGVRINGYGFDIPDEFVLQLSGDGPAKDGTYRVIWRFASEIGAKFVGPAPREA